MQEGRERVRERVEQKREERDERDEPVPLSSCKPISVRIIGENDLGSGGSSVLHGEILRKGREDEPSARERERAENGRMRVDVRELL